MKKYFENSWTVEEVKTEYRRLAFANHPDHGGNVEEMKEINTQYEAALKGYHGTSSVGSDGKDHTYYYHQDIERSTMVVINELLKLKMEDVEIMLIGKWIWISGNTKPYKDGIKSVGDIVKETFKVKWHSKRFMWYYCPISSRKTRYSGASIDQLADAYGYQNFTGQNAKEENAVVKS